MRQQPLDVVEDRLRGVPGIPKRLVPEVRWRALRITVEHQHGSDRPQVDDGLRDEVLAGEEVAQRQRVAHLLGVKPPQLHFDIGHRRSPDPRDRPVRCFTMRWRTVRVRRFAHRSWRFRARYSNTGADATRTPIFVNAPGSK